MGREGGPKDRATREPSVPTGRAQLVRGHDGPWGGREVRRTERPANRACQPDERSLYGGTIDHGEGGPKDRATREPSVPTGRAQLVRGHDRPWGGRSEGPSDPRTERANRTSAARTGASIDHGEGGPTGGNDARNVLAARGAVTFCAYLGGQPSRRGRGSARASAWPSPSERPARGWPSPPAFGVAPRAPALALAASRPRPRARP